MKKRFPTKTFDHFHFTRKITIYLKKLTVPTEQIWKRLEIEL